ncbi:hypothetical protein AQ477_27245 [Burkholderia thailandensis]|nr:hypothetical protein AQ477_27245 [Burkholderia thailandensis]KXF59530.1 hypothetical protein AQ476_20185 [Burkholderia thailandensis]
MGCVRNDHRRSDAGSRPATVGRARFAERVTAMQAPPAARFACRPPNAGASRSPFGGRRPLFVAVVAVAVVIDPTRGSGLLSSAIARGCAPRSIERNRAHQISPRDDAK